MALIMPKEHASNTPKIHVKYHIFDSLIDGMRLIEISTFNATTHNVKTVRCVTKYNRNKETGDEKHDIQC